jgi:hypothetical protein
METLFCSKEKSRGERESDKILVERSLLLRGDYVYEVELFYGEFLRRE